MPLMKYLSFGSALVLLLLAMNWLPPEPTATPVYSGIERPAIRISSIETRPERVVFDNSTPHMARLSSAMRVSPVSLQSALAFEQITPGLLPTFSTLAQVNPTKMFTKRDPIKKVVINRVAPQVRL
jgi:hypothetical protein